MEWQQMLHQVRKSYTKNFIYNEFTFTYASSYIEKMDRNVKKYSSHTEIYECVLIWAIYICDVIKKICKTISCSIFQ